jgi:hypothetical protein
MCGIGCVLCGVHLRVAPPSAATATPAPASSAIGSVGASHKTPEAASAAASPAIAATSASTAAAVSWLSGVELEWYEKYLRNSLTARGMYHVFEGCS